MKAQKSYDELIQFLIANYSFYSVCPYGSHLEEYLNAGASNGISESESAA